MLKITTRTQKNLAIFELEGKLAGPWVQALRDCWLHAGGKQPSRVLLNEVTFIDAAGKELLAEMHRNGAELVGEGCMTKAIIAEIERR